MIIVISLIFNHLVSIYIDFDSISKNYVTLLNGMGVLTSFFILSIDKVNLVNLNSRFKKMENIAFSKKEIRQGTKALNLIFSLTFSMFILLGMQYILLFLNKISLLLLIMLIVYIFAGFIIILGIWHGLELIEVENVVD